MLVLTRKKDESIKIGEDIEIVVVEVSEDRVRLGINAPRHMKIFRAELLKQIEEENIKSAEQDSIDLSQIKQIIKKP